MMRLEFRTFWGLDSMGFSENSDHSWNPVMTTKTATLDYWWNWRVLLCAIWILLSMIAASLLIWRYEGPTREREGGAAEQKEEADGILYEDETWRPCLKDIHPAWLLVFRIVSFFSLSVLLLVYIAIHGGSSFYYYTQWTFALVTVYFGLGSVLSANGCHQFLNKVDGVQNGHLRSDEEQGTYVAPPDVQNASSSSSQTKRNGCQNGLQKREVAGFWGYTFQIIYQINAGAVMLTDFVFWLIIVPFLEMKDYDLNAMMVGMHSVNAIFLLGDTALNSLRFPWFRISYFILWTATYVFFQWIIHACVSTWWPYPFLDLSSTYSPIWYLIVALMHIPCYGIFILILKLKHSLLSRWFPHSYQLVK